MSESKPPKKPSRFKDVLKAHDPARVQAVQLGEQVLLHQIGMQRRNPVHLMRHDEGQLG